MKVKREHRPGNVLCTVLVGNRGFRGIVEVGSDHLPDVVLEVDCSTDATIAREDPAGLVAEALACRDEADLPARLEARRRTGRV